MTDDLMGYQKKLDQALRGVVRESLIEIAGDGLPGDHHFYITFRTVAPGVEISNVIRAQYPEEMTIVLQHQFWGLEIYDDSFEVTLSFNRKSERLFVPFDAVTAFLDPAVSFGLQFDGNKAANADGEIAASTTVGPTGEVDPTGADEKTGDKTGQVVTLDSFRKR